MSAQTSIELHFPSILGYEVVARRVVASFANYVGFETERIEDLKTAVSEACINAIEHGNQLAPDLPVRITTSFDGHCFTVDVHDSGKVSLEQVGTPNSIEDKLAGLAALRGMGMMLMAQLTDELIVVPPTHNGNTVRLIWYQRDQLFESAM